MSDVGSRASLTGVVVERSGQYGIWAADGGVVSLHGGSVAGRRGGEVTGGRIEHH